MGGFPEVFDATWLAEKEHLARRFGHEQPLAYRVATSPRLAHIRRQVEKIVAKLPEESRDALVPRLRSEGFLAAYHELAVGGLLMTLGHRVDYEPALASGDQTLRPDWVAVGPGGRRVAVEVLSPGRSEDSRAVDAARADLRARLHRLPHDCMLSVSCPDGDVRLSQAGNKAIARSVDRWLRGGAVPGGQMVEAGVQFTIGMRDVGLDSVATVGPGGSFWVDTPALSAKIREKGAKYQDVSASHDMPFVLAVVPDQTAGYGEDDLVDVLWGEDVLGVTFDRTDGTVIATRRSRAPGGLFAEGVAGLSGMLWALMGAFGSWHARLHRNPLAAVPVDAELIPDTLALEGDEQGGATADSTEPAAPSSAG